MARQKRGEVRREQILEAANRLFRQQGYTATSMRQIAAEAGFGGAASGLYNHFSSKEAIFTALLIAHSPYEDLMHALQQVQGATFQEFLRNWFDQIWPVVNSHADFIQLVFIDLQEFEGQTLARFLSGFLPRYYDLFARILQMPGIRQDLPLPVLIRTIASTMIGYLVTEIMVRQALADGVPFPVATGDEWIGGLVAILTQGMSAPK